MLIFTNFSDVSRYDDELIELGYGLCVLRQFGQQKPFNLEAYLDVLSDWGMVVVKCQTG